MKVSTKGRYGLRALVDLICHTGEGAVSLVNIAQRQEISLPYLEQVFSVLRKAGMIKSVKGARGGYLLAGKPEDYSVGDVLALLEGRISLTDGNNEVQQNSVQMAIHNLVWSQINEQMNRFLDSVTLEDLVLEYQRLNIEQVNMYYI